MKIGNLMKTKYNILIVDDEEHLLFTLADALNLYEDSLNVFTANNGEKALEILSKNHIKLVITDVKMPGMDGLTLLLKAKKKYPNIYFIVMTAYGNIEIQNKAKYRGAVFYMEKPFDFDFLLELIFKILEPSDFLEKAKTHSFDLINALQILQLGNSSTKLLIKDKSGKVGSLYINDGLLCHAELDDLQGEKAFYTILKLDGEIQTQALPMKIPYTINTDISILITKAIQSIDINNIK